MMTDFNRPANRINFDACIYDPRRGRLSVRPVDLNPACDADVVEVGIYFGSLTHVMRFERDWMSTLDESAPTVHGRFRLTGITNVDCSWGDEDWMERIHTLVVEDED